jgi:hypothetical protein
LEGLRKAVNNSVHCVGVFRMWVRREVLFILFVVY